jgi:hypothetical protein
MGTFTCKLVRLGKQPNERWEKERVKENMRCSTIQASDGKDSTVCEQRKKPLHANKEKFKYPRAVKRVRERLAEWQVLRLDSFVV